MLSALCPKEARRWTDISASTAIFTSPRGKTPGWKEWSFRILKINLFFYDGPISQDIAFGGLLSSGEAFVDRLLKVFNDQRDWPQIVHIATDGETYGHHHRFGDMALAYCLHLIESRNSAKLTNYGEYLEQHPSTYWVEVFDHSSWSCVHGVERWKVLQGITLNVLNGVLQ